MMTLKDFIKELQAIPTDPLRQVDALARRARKAQR